MDREKIRNGDYFAKILEKAVESIKKELSFNERVSAYIIAEELLFWKTVKDRAERRIQELENLVPVEVRREILEE